MIIKSLRTEIAILALASILTVSALVLWFSINAYEALYQKSAAKGLNGLSENLAVELIPSVDEQDDFAIANVLLKLDQYDNVRFAAVLSEKGEVLNSYLGKALIRNKTPEQIIAMPKINYERYTQYPKGISLFEGRITIKKRIGDPQASLGFLVLQNDLSSPLEESKKSLLKSVLPWVILTLAINVFVILVFQNLALNPLIQLAKFTRKIRDTKDYSLVARVRGKREIAAVTVGLNSMMQAINIEVEKNKQKNKLLIQQQNQMEKLANYDALTGLPNRQFFMEKLRIAMASAQKQNTDLILLFFDLDGFKLVNDSFGHDIGDQLLCVIAERLCEIVGPGNKVARLGGDEFLVMLDDNIDDQEILRIANRFIERISEKININLWDVQVGTSIGIAKASVADFNLTELVANADIAMYRAKADGRNRYTVFSQDMIESSRRKLAIANAINEGLNKHEFYLCYQIKVDIHGYTVGLEALARWHNSALGHISPAEFIPIAEQSGKVPQITEWLISQVCKDSLQIFEARANIKIALNLSVYDLKNKHLSTMIQQQMLQYNVKPAQLEFEITESAYLDNFQSANAVIEEIKNMGSSIALDDFGTGYSSLSYLTQINIDTLKIDKQFVDKIGISKRSTLVTNTIIEMAKHLNLEVCAEGVESLEQSKLLIENGCHTLQGYYFGKPQALEQIVTHLKEG